MAFTEDLSVFFNSDEFGVACTVNGTPNLVGVLNEAYAEEEDVTGYAPELHIAKADVPGGTVEGDAVVIGARTFAITELRPDESDLVTILGLEYVSG